MIRYVVCIGLSLTTFEQIPGFEIFSKDKAGELIVSLEPYYFTFVDVVDFRDLALKTMMEFNEQIGDLKVCCLTFALLNRSVGVCSKWG